MQPHHQDRLTAIGETESLNPSMAWACTVYALVPYLGILFVPFAVFFGAIELFRSPQTSSRNTIVPLALTIPIVAGQLVLWWLLYLIPEIGL